MSRAPRGRHALLAVTALLLAAAPALLGGGAAADPAAGSRRVEAPPPTVQVPAPPDSAVLERRKLGESVDGRPILAYRLGEPAGAPRSTVATIVLIAAMHGNEQRSRVPLLALKDGPALVGADVWLVPTYNPDGFAAGTRKNARGVDLNRNYPNDWADLDGNYESGSGPASEPETTSVMAFLREVRPDRILSFHQPLHGVDTDTLDADWARRVADTLKLPRKTFDCGGVCHGTMTGWYNNNFRGSALTVEFGANPGDRYLRKTIPARIRSLFGIRQGHYRWGVAGR